MSYNKFHQFDLNNTKSKGKFRFKPKRRHFWGALIGGLVIFFYILVLSAPKGFPSQTTITIDSNQTLTDISSRLQENHIVRYGAAFQFFVILYGGEKNIAPGDYYLPEPMNVFMIAKMFIARLHGVNELKVTLFEGYSRDTMADMFASKFKNFSKPTFLYETKDDEGYLFPDTYFFFPNTGTTDIISVLRDTYTKRITPLLPEIAASGKTENEIITMASLIEKETDRNPDRAMVAGILWKRIKKGIPLQVDASIGYLTGKTNEGITMADLKINSPYNTYINKGLPPGPISNPGLSSIKAALHPIASQYLYYLHDKNGHIHYAVNFEEHKKNIAQYLSR